jgi:hypothetical protein
VKLKFTKMKKIKLKQWLYIAGLLCVSVSCKEKLTGCDLDASCCGISDPSADYVLIAKLENAPADYGNGALFLKMALLLKNLKLSTHNRAYPYANTQIIS